MGGPGSGRPPGVAGLVKSQQAAAYTSTEDFILPNYSGLKPEVLKTDPTAIGEQNLFEVLTNGNDAMGLSMIGISSITNPDGEGVIDMIGKQLKSDGGSVLVWEDNGVNFPSGIIDDYQYESIDPNYRILYAASGYPALDWSQFLLYNDNGTPIVDFSDGVTGNINFMNGLQFQSGYYANLYDGNGIVLLDPNNRIIYDASAIVSGNWTLRTLNDSGGNQSIDWGNRILYDQTGQYSLAYGVHTLYDNASFNSIDYNARTLWDSSGMTVSADYGNYLLYDSSTISSFNWTNRQLFDSGGNQSIYWDTRMLSDDSNQYSIDWGTRTIYSNLSTPMIDYSGSVAAGVILENGIYNGNFPYGLSFDTNACAVYDTMTVESMDFDGRQAIGSDGMTFSFQWDNGAITLPSYQNVINTVEGMLAYNFLLHKTTYFNGTTWV